MFEEGIQKLFIFFREPLLHLDLRGLAYIENPFMTLFLWAGCLPTSPESLKTGDAHHSVLCRDACKAHWPVASTRHPHSQWPRVDVLDVPMTG